MMTAISLKDGEEENPLDGITRAYWDKVASFRTVVFSHIRNMSIEGNSEVHINFPRGGRNETEALAFITDVIRPMNQVSRPPRAFEFIFEYAYELNDLKVRLVRKKKELSCFC
jgi:hypothetical protein